MDKKLLSPVVVVALAAFTLTLCVSQVNSEGCDVDCTITLSLQNLITALKDILTAVPPVIDVTVDVRSAIEAWVNITLPDSGPITLLDLGAAIECLTKLLTEPIEGCLLDAVLKCLAELLKVTVEALKALLPDGLCVEP